MMSSLASKLSRKIVRNYTDYGAGAVLAKGFAGIISLFGERRSYIIYRKPLSEADLETGPCDSRFTFRLLDEEEESSIAQIEASEEWLKDQIKQRLASGSLCLVAEEGDRIAGFNLVSFGKVYMPLVNYWRTFLANEAWSEQITVLPDFRRCGLGAALRMHVFQELRKRGIMYFYGGTLPSNTGNRKLSKRVGFRETSLIRYYRLLSIRRWRTIPLSEPED